MNFYSIHKKFVVTDRYGAFLFSLVLVAGSWSGLSCTYAQSSSALTAVYGRGVHAYFAGNTSLAEQYFTQVIQAGSTDPRPYYFRAVLRLQTGKRFEAENDMRVGAAYEARDPGAKHSIGRALQRVQGPGRRILEKFRRQARLDRLQQGQQQTRQRYEQRNRRTPGLLRRPTQVPLNQTIQPPQVQAPISNAPPVGSDAKWAGSNTKQAGSNTKQAGSGTQPMLGSDSKSMGSEAKPDGSGLKPLESTNVEESDPFGSPAPVTPSEDLFGSGTKSTPESTPQLAPTPAPEEVDLFGEETAAEKPAEESTAVVEETEADPFGESAEPADEVFAEEDDDPFGETLETTDESADDAAGGEAPTDEASTGEEGGDAEPVDEEDPFGPFSSTTPAPAGSASASPSAVNAPTGQLFFALGQWFGSRGNQAAPDFGAGASAAAAVAPAGFDFGPTDSGRVNTATAEVAPEDDLFGAEEDTTVDSSDQMTTENEVTREDQEDDPFGGDPFGEDDPFGEL